MANKRQAVTIALHELRALLHWASFGISRAYSGSYKDAADAEGKAGIVSSLANSIGFYLSRKPSFRVAVADRRSKAGQISTLAK